MTQTTLTIGPYVVGEIPAPLEYQFLDSAGSPINLTGYTAKFQRGVKANATNYVSVATLNATVTDAANGKVTYTWVAADFSGPGTYGGMFYVGNGTNRFASLLITWITCAAVDVAPSI